MPYPLNRRPIISTDIISSQPTPYPANRRPILLIDDAGQVRIGEEEGAPAAALPNDAKEGTPLHPKP